MIVKVFERRRHLIVFIGVIRWTMMTPASPSQTIALAQNRVLRNTYALLALSLVPTVLGAWIGVQMNFSFFQASPAIGFINCT